MTAEVLAIPDVLPAFMARMQSGLAARGWDDVTVTTKVPVARPARFVRVRLDATLRASIAHALVTITVESWASSEVEADHLGAVCYALACAAETDDPYSYAPRDATVLGPHPSPDPDSGQDRSICAVRLAVAVEQI
ncbi:MAG: hypothetical protein LBE08_10385 [Bifidobacteriaceae bacterium]|jgi:hypothetical protein|nr:hypothetical protein [Bifidobacteriaceae bacterium]